MKEIEQVRLPRLPIIRINSDLNKYENLPLFQEKVDEATEIVRKYGVPDILKEMESLSNNEEKLLMRINYTIEQIQKYDSGIKQAVLLSAEPFVIEGWQMMKARSVARLIKMMAEMDVDLELKTAA